VSTQLEHSYRSDPETASAVLKAALYCWNHPNRGAAVKPRAFVTVSRQPGTGGRLFAHRLMERLNEMPAGDWTAWDNELFDRISAEDPIEKQVLEALEQQPLTWLDEFVRGYSMKNGRHHMPELYAYKRIAMAIRALAEAGHTILVGRGSQFVTDEMSGGIHVRLVAPIEHRIKYVAAKFNLSSHNAASRIAAADGDRQTFYRRFWAGKEIDPETFDATLNVAELCVNEMVECVLPLIRAREGVASVGLNARQGPAAMAPPR